MKPHGSILKDLEAKALNKGQSSFRRKDVVLVQGWKDNRLMRMISIIHDSEHVHTGNKY
jgi:hypothetical protein